MRDLTNERESVVAAERSRVATEGWGWNCDAPPSTRSSFNSTIRVLEGLSEYERAYGASAAISESRVRAHEYLLERQLLRSMRTGDVIDRRWMRFAFPTTWHYDVLRALDYFRSAGTRSTWMPASAKRVIGIRYAHCACSIGPGAQLFEADSRRVVEYEIASIVSWRRACGG